jgi:hypothetical protein
MINYGNGITKIWELSGAAAETNIALRNISSKYIISLQLKLYQI